MVRIVGVNLPDDKRLDYALTRIYGIGWSRSSEILSKAGVEPGRQVKDLDEQELKRVQESVEKYRVEGALRESLRDAVKRLRESGTYRGQRHAKGLPVRGQRTRSNARTKRGKRKTVGALKKEEFTKIGQTRTD